jgi:hypothetical protein
LICGLTETLARQCCARILANRQSAQRSRVRKLQYISELERSVTTLQVYRIIASIHTNIFLPFLHYHV